MVERRSENQSPGLGAGDAGRVNSAVECDEYSGDDESTISLDEYDDVTTDGGGREGVGVSLAAAVQRDCVPSFGSVSVNNSTDIHFGNKTFYHGPVTIKQVVYASGKDGDFPGAPEPQPQPQTLPTPSGAPPVAKGVVHDPDRRDALKLCLGQATRRRRCLLWLVGVSVLVAVVVTLTTLLVVVGRTNNDADADDDEADEPTNVTLSGKMRLLGRKDWLAQPATEALSQLELPVPYVIISHTATEQCHSQAQCVYIVRITQTFHIESRGWSDIGYNFLVGGDGYVYTGRGWTAVGAHAYGFNICSIGISFIGTFITEHPTPRQFLAATQLIEEGVRLGKISKHYRLLGHRQVSATESPGQALFDDIRALPHWLKDPLPCSETSKLTTLPTPPQNTTSSHTSSVTIVS